MASILADKTRISSGTIRTRNRPALFYTLSGLPMIRRNERIIERKL